MTARITKINRIRGYRSFRDFAWPPNLEPFARFNLIYGWNGSGKTALSDLFRNLETRQPVDPVDGDVQFEVGGTTVSGSDIPSVTLPQVRVFNRNSVDRTVFEVPARQLPPVLYLGEDSVEKQKRVLAHRESRARKQEEATTWKKTRDKAQADFEKFCTDQARDLRVLLLTSGGGGPYRNYQAPAFKVAASQLLQSIPDSFPLADDVRRRRNLSSPVRHPGVRITEVASPFPLAG